MVPSGLRPTVCRRTLIAVGLIVFPWWSRGQKAIPLDSTQSGGYGGASPTCEEVGIAGISPQTPWLIRPATIGSFGLLATWP